MNDDSGRESVESKKIITPRSIPKVKFSTDGDITSSASPNDSISSNE